ncbi:RNA polymerase sigma factor [Erysipelothrix aquatica]|uniref:RNA polymerase sigma factor n=1 Tax=Erysipelothrix aquatica TaxID=2683714 RepID=UPI0013599015|nr:sigma-70 family RNA polymerase sigma factor [Erysipelothrix aquatica]
MKKEVIGTPIRYIHDGDIDFEFLYERSIEGLRHIVTSSMGDTSWVDDIVQEAYIRAFQRIEDLDTLVVEVFCKWIHRIALNIANDMYRKRKVLSFSDIDDLMVSKTLSKMPVESRDPSKLASTEERNRMIRNAVKRLSKKQREVVYLFYFRDLTTKEIARKYAVSESTIKSRLRYARVNLAKTFEKLKIMNAIEWDAY